MKRKWKSETRTTNPRLSRPCFLDQKLAKRVMFCESPLNLSVQPRHLAETWTSDVFSKTGEMQSRLTVYSRKEGFAIGENEEILWFAPEELKELYDEETDTLVFIGNEKMNGQEIDRLALVVLEASEGLKKLASFDPDLRKFFQTMPVLRVNTLGIIKAKADWHLDNQFCPKCGARSVPVQAGAKRQCTKCRTKNYPTMQPTAIMAIQDENGRLLLCRQKKWPKDLWSCLSGFCDIGESIEEAVARETFEEAAIRIDMESVTILKSQPWPISRGSGCAFMIGCSARAVNTDIVVDENENENIKWFTLEQVKAMLKESNGTGLRVPGTFAVANFIIQHVVKEAESP